MTEIPIDDKVVVTDKPRFKKPSGSIRPISEASDEFAKRLGHDPQYYGANYLSQFTNPEKLRQRIEYAVKALKGHTFDSIAFSGMSGALIGPPVALELGKTFLLVRKEDDDSHSRQKVEGDYAAKDYVILDDFSESGYTNLYIKDTIRGIMPDAKCVGMLGVKWVTAQRLATYEAKGELYPLQEV